MPVAIKWFPPSWIQINSQGKLIYIDPAYNTANGRSTRKQHKKGEGVGYLLKLEHQTIYHAGDTDYLPEMHEFGQVDVALLPVGGTFTMDIDEAVAAARAIHPRVLIPMHRFETDLQKLAGALEDESDIKLIPLDIGETYCLKYPG